MRIALAHMRHAGTGGTERYLDLLARHLAARGDEVTIVCRSHEEARHPAVRFRVLRDFAIGGAWRMWAFARALERHVARESYDLVLGLGKTWTHDVIRLGGGCHQTYLETAHDATLSKAERALGKGFLKHRLALKIETRALAPGHFRVVITNSDMVRRDVMRRHAVPEQAIEVIYNGVDLERFHPRHRNEAGGDLRRSLGFDEQDTVVLFLGSGYGRKGLDRVLEAFPELVARRPRAKLMVVGYDSAQATFEARAQQLGIAPNTRFLGGRRDAEHCYGAADLYVLPTRYDPFANSTLEALASGLPVITTDTNGGAELIQAGVQGAIVGHETDETSLTRELVAWCDVEHLDSGRKQARALAEGHAAESKLEATARLLDRVVAGEFSSPVSETEE